MDPATVLCSSQSTSSLSPPKAAGFLSGVAYIRGERKRACTCMQHYIPVSRMSTKIGCLKLNILPGYLHACTMSCISTGTVKIITYPRHLVVPPGFSSLPLLPRPQWLPPSCRHLHCWWAHCVPTPLRVKVHTRVCSCLCDGKLGIFEDLWMFLYPRRNDSCLMPLLLSESSLPLAEVSSS